MFSTVIEYLTSTTVLCAIAYVAGGLTWPTLKDKITGVPAGFRTAINSLEAKAKVDVQNAIADVFSKISPAPVPPPAPPPAPPKA